MSLDVDTSFFGSGWAGLGWAADMVWTGPFSGRNGFWTCVLVLEARRSGVLLETVFRLRDLDGELSVWECTSCTGGVWRGLELGWMDEVGREGHDTRLRKSRLLLQGGRSSLAAAEAWRWIVRSPDAGTRSM